HGFLYDGSNFSTLDYPGSDETYLAGIDGENIVGRYRDMDYDNHGFIYNGGVFSILDYPDAYDTYTLGIDGDNIVGHYKDSSGEHGFLYTIPEPSTIILLGLGAVMLRKRKRRK
ncbi:MAG: PEP-CTERM sorting domain-containing protein, partial [Planctomycetota bacterium]